MTVTEEALLVAAIGAALLSAAVIALDLRARTRSFAGQLYTVAAPLSELSSELFFVGLHGMLRSPLERLVRGQPPVAVELAARDGEVQLQLWVSDDDRELVVNLLRGTYPGVVLSRAKRAAHPASRRVVSLGLRDDPFLPIRTDFQAEPLAPLVAALAAVPPGCAVTLQLVVRPRADGWRRSAFRRADALRALQGRERARGHARSASTRERQRAAAIAQKAGHPGFECALRIVADGQRPDDGPGAIRSVSLALGTYTESNGFGRRGGALFAATGRLAERRALPPFGSLLLTAPELAALWHLPAEPLPRLHTAHGVRLPPPRGATCRDRALGLSTWADEGVPVGLSIADSRHHLHLLGPTGTGKTTALINLASADIAAGRGVGVLDPKGDLVAALLERIPPGRLQDVVLIAPEGDGQSVGINPLEVGPTDDADLVADNALTIFRRIYERSWGMRTDDILKSTLLTLLRRPGSTLAHIPLLLVDPVFRSRTVGVASDPLALDSFWIWFNKLTEYQRNEAIGPVLNKLRDFLLRPRLRRVLCQPRSTVDLRTVVDSGQILLADLSVGRWGETTSALLGSFLVAKLWQAVLARAARPEEERRDFFLFIDEFQHFLGISGPFGDALAEARSLRLSLTVANQHLGQLPRELRDAVASNARSRAVFQCGPDDAAALEREFAPLRAASLLALPRFEMAVRLSVDGRTCEPFTARTLAPAQPTDPAIAAAVRAASLARYGRPGEAVDRELREALAPTVVPAPKGLGVGVRTRG